MVIASIGFVVCWSPNEWYYFAYNVGLPLTFTGIVYEFTVVMVSLHSCINPFIYVANYHQFRDAMRRFFRCCKSSETFINAELNVLQNMPERA